MANNDVTIVKGQGGLGKEFPSQDHVSGIIFFGTKPAGFGTDTVKKVTTLEEAEAFGLTIATYPVENYHISEFYRQNEGAELWIGYFATPGTWNFAELATLQNTSLGVIRQVGIYTQSRTNTSLVADLASIQAVVTTLFEDHKPTQVVYAVDISAVTDLTTLPDLRAQNAPNVSVVIGQDGGAKGADLYVSEGDSITCIGAVLGAISRSLVHENIGWVDKFNLSDGTELETPAFANSSLFVNLTDTVLNGLNTKGYLFLRPLVGKTGAWLRDSHTAVAITSDFAHIETNRAIDKAVRLIYASILPNINAPVYVNPTTGQLSREATKEIETKCEQPIRRMVANGELSGGKVFVSPAQNVLATSKIEVTAKLVPVGVSRDIDITISYTPKIS
jgi:hypothetical protein